MKTFKCKDGQNRVFTKREIVLGSEEMAILLLSKFVYEDDPVALVTEMKRKSVLLEAVWEEIFASGRETPHYKVFDNYDDAESVVAEAQAHIKKIFKDIS